MAYKIEEIEGIGAKSGKLLRVADIQTTDDLLRNCSDKRGRTRVAKKTGLSETLLLEWVNLADLMRIKGVGEEYADLLEEAGVDTVKELAKRNAVNLAVAMKEINTKKKLSRTNPSAKTLEKWITEAKKLVAVVTH